MTAVVEDRRLCACGCGEPVSPKARFRLGHQAPRSTEQRICRLCGRRFRAVNTSTRTICTARPCRSTDAWVAEQQRARASEHARALAGMRDVRRQRTVTERALIAQEKARYYRVYAHAAREDRERERLRQIRVAASNARERARQTRLWLESSRDDMEREQMQLLLTQQEADAQRDQVQYEPSFDAPVGDGTGDQRRTYGGHAVHFDRPGDEWPYRAELGRRGRLVA